MASTTHHLAAPAGWRAQIALFCVCLSIVLAGCHPISAERVGVAPTGEARAAVRETVVGFESEGQRVVGTLALPAAKVEPYPVVLMLHGFTNVRDELPVAGTSETMYQRAARVFAESGIASLRIDFRGSGDSDGEWPDTTFTGQISDTLRAIDFLAETPGLDMDRLAVLGFSQGGLVAAEAAVRDPRVGNVVLWSAVANAPDTYKHILTNATVDAALTGAAPRVPVVTQWGASFELGRGFFADLYRYDPVAAVAQDADPLLVVVGRQDTTVTPQPAYGELFLHSHEGMERLVIVDSDHVFNVLTDPGPDVFDHVVAETNTWLAETLVPPAPQREELP